MQIYTSIGGGVIFLPSIICTSNAIRSCFSCSGEMTASSSIFSVIPVCEIYLDNEAISVTRNFVCRFYELRITCFQWFLNSPRLLWIYVRRCYRVVDARLFFCLSGSCHKNRISTCNCLTRSKKTSSFPAGLTTWVGLVGGEERGRKRETSFRLLFYFLVVAQKFPWN